MRISRFRLGGESLQSFCEAEPEWRIRTLARALAKALEGARSAGGGGADGAAAASASKTIMGTTLPRQA